MICVSIDGYLKSGQKAFDVFLKNQNATPNDASIQKGYKNFYMAYKLDPTNADALSGYLFSSMFSFNIDSAVRLLKASQKNQTIHKSVLMLQILNTFSNFAAIHVHLIDDRQKFENLFELICDLFDDDNVFALVSVGMYMQFLIGALGDSKKAYVIGTQSLRKHDAIFEEITSGFFQMFIMACLDENVCEYGEVIKYAPNIIASTKDLQYKAVLMSQYGLAMAKIGDSAGSNQILSEALKLYSDDTIYFNVASAKYALRLYKEAKDYILNNLNIHKDESNAMLLADTYKKLKMYQDAVDCYKEAIDFVITEQYIQTYETKQSKTSYSVISSKAADRVMQHSLFGIIGAYAKQKNYQQASIYLTIAKQKYPNNSELEALADVIDYVEASEQELKRKLAKAVRKFLMQFAVVM